MHTMNAAILFGLSLFLGLPGSSEAQGEAQGGTQVVISTSKGDVRAELFDAQSSETVQNFLSYVDDEFYDGTIFHRVIRGFMIQGGGLTRDMRQKQTREPVTNEATNGLKNVTGTLAMARTIDLHSATAQFFINVADNDFLDHKDESIRGFGYCVFGRVVEGMDVVHDIETVETGRKSGHEDVPSEPVVIHSIRRVAPSSEG